MSELSPDAALSGERVLERLREQPGGAELMAVALEREGVDLVGGAVRDLLLDCRPRELDVVVADDAAELAHALAARLHAEVTLHERFGTAQVEGVEARIDVATRRAELYPAPGALPEVRAGTPEEDLLRRDFTVNAIAVGLDRARRAELRHAPYALEDLRAGRLRVLHERSFLDDPTRLLRLARYRVRLDFAVEDHTERLAREALAGGALAGVSGARLGAELRLALSDVDPLATLLLLDRDGLLAAVHPGLRFDERLAAQAVELLPADGRLDLLLLAVAALKLVRSAGDSPRAGDARRTELQALLDRLEFTRAERDHTVAAALTAVRLAHELPACTSAAELYELAAAAPLEGVALAGALGGPGNGRSGVGEIARRWLQDLRHVRLAITGEDLLAAGVPQGPDIGRRLRATLALRLNGELEEGREAELAAALGFDG